MKYNEKIAQLQLRENGQKQTLDEHRAYIAKIVALGNPDNLKLIQKLEGQASRHADNLQATQIELATVRGLAKTDTKH